MVVYTSFCFHLGFQIVLTCSSSFSLFFSAFGSVLVGIRVIRFVETGTCEIVWSLYQMCRPRAETSYFEPQIVPSRLCRFPFVFALFMIHIVLLHVGKWTISFFREAHLPIYVVHILPLSPVPRTPCAPSIAVKSYLEHNFFSNIFITSSMYIPWVR